MLRALLAIGFLFVAAVLLVGSAGANDKVTICHIPPGNPENAHEVTVSVHAWPAHQEHGDFIVTESAQCPPATPVAPTAEPVQPIAVASSWSATPIPELPPVGQPVFFPDTGS